MNNIKSFKQIIKKYIDRNKKYLFSKNILHEMNGVVLVKTNNSIFDFHEIVIKEVKQYCKEQGYDIDKVVFISSYDLDLIEGPNLNLKMQGDSKISILKENDLIIARVFIGEFVEVVKYGN